MILKRRARRAVRKQWAIYGVLARKGPMSETSLCLELEYALGTLYPDLAVLERKGYISPQWVEGTEPRLRIYEAVVA